jgi:hypothetical protein
MGVGLAGCESNSCMHMLTDLGLYAVGSWDYCFNSCFSSKRRTAVS